MIINLKYIQDQYHSHIPVTLVFLRNKNLNLRCFINISTLQGTFLMHALLYHLKHKYFVKKKSSCSISKKQAEI